MVTVQGNREISLRPMSDDYARLSEGDAVRAEVLRLPVEAQVKETEAQLQSLNARLGIIVAIHGRAARSGARAPTFPNVMALGYMRDQRLRVVKPIKVRFVRHGAQVVAEAVDFNEFGYGDSRAEALADLQLAVAGLYVELRHNRDRLGADLTRTWKRLERSLRWDEHQVA